MNRAERVRRGLILIEGGYRPYMRLYAPDQPRGRDGKWVYAGGPKQGEHEVTARGSRRSAVNATAGHHEGLGGARGGRTSVVPVRATPGTPARLDAFFGRHVRPSEVRRMVGADPDAEVRIRHEPYGVHGGVFHIRVTGPGGRYTMDRSFERLADGRLMMYNNSFEVRGTGTGLGTRIFARQARVLRRMRFDAIRLTAARGGSDTGVRYNGYYTWPRLGVDGRVSVYHEATRSWHSESVLDLMRTPGGRATWREEGHEFVGEFDLHQGSRSWQVLNAYLSERG